MQKITGQKNNGPDVTLETKIEFLKRPESYPDRPRKVEFLETHMSWVFLTENYAYKLKKPVRNEYLDFSTVDARHHDCEEEIRLNRRLARDVYIGIVPLTADAERNILIGGNNTAVDWLVKMRRLPTEKMLDYEIKTQTVNKAEIARFALMLARFYKKSPPIEISLSEYKQRFELEIQDNLRVLTIPEYGLPIDLPPEVCAAQLDFLKRKSELFSRRVQERRIIEAHGDLRPEHICLEAEPLIIDSLEFKRKFRILDPADELSFLALECERLSAPPFVNNVIFETYNRITGDTPEEHLVKFYKSCRAGLRAKLAIRHLQFPEIPDISKWRNLAKIYLDMAKSHICQASEDFST